MSRSVMRIENALRGQHSTSIEPPVLDDWSKVDERIVRYCEKAMTYFADVGAVGIELRTTDVEEHWIVWCFHVRDGARIFTVINDKTRRRKRENRNRLHREEAFP